MGWTRYAALDAYTLEELQRAYKEADKIERIRLLKRLFKTGGIPEKVAVMAAEDADCDVRQCLARQFNGRVVVEREPKEAHEKVGDEQRAASNAIETLLKNDPDPFVRACLHENAYVFGGLPFMDQPWIAYFQKATHMERLALMRNPGVGTKLIEKVFDPEEKELGIDIRERRELCRAFLTNKRKLHWLKDEAGLCAEHKGYWENLLYAEPFLIALWKLALKWPQDSDIPALIVAYVPADGLSFIDEQTGQHKHIKVEVFRAIPRLRHMMLYRCGPRDRDVIEVAMHDEDENVRLAAFQNLSYAPDYLVSEFIGRKDKIALRGLGMNEAVSVEMLKKISECSKELDPNWPDSPWDIIARKKKAKISEDPEQLFDKDGRGRIDEKLNFIGKILIGPGTARANPALVWARIAAIASVLALLRLLIRL